MTQFFHENDLIAYMETRGFKQYHSVWATPGVVRNFQRRYEDDLGIRYFIEAKEWSWHDVDPYGFPYSLEFSAQFYRTGTHDAINMTFIGWELSQVEKWVDDLFATGLIEHYQLNAAED